MNANPVTWFELYVQDIPRAKRFYESVFDLKLNKLNSPMPDTELWAFPMEQDRVGAGGALVKMKGFPSGGNTTIIYFACKDCAVEEKRVLQFGGRVQKPKTSIGEYGAISLAYDTEGNLFGLHSM